jgi:hypothetical protein
VNAAQLPWTLSLNANAITMSLLAPYDTLQLTAVARTATGSPLTSTTAVTYTSSDSAVRVSPTGLLTARGASDGVVVIATAMYQGIRISDTAIVSVTADTLPKMAGVDVALDAGDSAKFVAYGNDYFYYFYDRNFSFGFKTLLVGVMDGDGSKLPHSQVELRTSDASRLNFYYGAGGNYPHSERFIVSDRYVDVKLGENSDPGPVTLYATATVYGVTMRDSLSFVVTAPMVYLFTVQKTTPVGSTTPVFTVVPAVQTRPIGIGGWVWWSNPNLDDSLDVVFDDPTAASPDVSRPEFNSGGGNIAPFAGALFDWLPFPGVRMRQFLRAGTFPWHSERTGVSGVVVVQ